MIQKKNSSFVPSRHVHLQSTSQIWTPLKEVEREKNTLKLNQNLLKKQSRGDNDVRYSVSLVSS
jgi:hypothetical protein